ncbi:uncharacterized protein FYW35_010575 [Pterocles gutturalis]
MVRVTPEPTPTTVTVRTTVYTTVYTSAADVKASEVKCWIDTHEILSVSLAFISGVLFAVLVFAIICLFRKKYKRSQQTAQERVPSQTVTEETANNVQNDIAYAAVVFNRSKPPVAV